MGRYDAFISYSRSDNALVELICRLLEINGKIFRDVDDIKPGDEWEAKIHDAMRNSDAVVLMWCCHAAGRPWVQKELEMAAGLQKKIIPVLLCTAPLPPYASRFQWVRMYDAVKHPCEHSRSEEEPRTTDGSEVRTIGPTELGLKLGYEQIPSDQLDRAWKRLVARKRLGAVVKADDLKAIAIIVLIVLFLLMSLWPDTFGLNASTTLILSGVLGTSLLVEAVVGVMRWRKFAGMEGLGLDADRRSKILALTLDFILKQRAAESAPPAPHDIGCGGCGCLIIILAATAALLSMMGR